MPRPCYGLRVLDFTASFPGALATMVLADSGAEVIKAEPPGGDPTRQHYASVMWHRGKRSIVLDLSTKEGQERARSLAAAADVVIESYRPGVADRLGIGYKALAKTNPGLVYCSISGFGSQGPLAKVRAYEQVVHAKSGRMDAFWGMTGAERPVYSAQLTTGYGAAMLAVQGILAALMVRLRCGQGQHVETSMLRAVTCFDLMAFLNWQLAQRNGTPLKRGYPGGPIPPYMTARTKDGHWLQMGNLTVNTQWNYVHALGLDGMVKDSRYAGMPKYADPADEITVQRACLSKIMERTRDEWMDLFMKSDVACEPFRTTQEGLQHPQALHNGNVIELRDPVVGRTVQLGPIGIYSETPTSPQGPAPAVGQHTTEVLSSFKAPRQAAAHPNGKKPAHPLSGMLVLELASFIAAPWVTGLLADLGARVIKIEPLTGDLYRAIGFPAMSKTLQGKEALALDLKDSRAQAAVHALIKKADVLLHNFRPGVPERLGIDYATARKLKPDIVYVYAGAYGSTGPHSHRTGFHPIAGAITGGPRYQLGRIVPPPETPMTLDRVQAMSNVLRRSNETNPDPSAALACAAATMAALYYRAATGKGQYLETSMLGGNLYANADDAVSYAGKPERPLADAEFNGLHALYRLYKTKQGWVFLAAPSQEEWEALTQAIGRPGLAADQRFATGEARRANDAALAAALAEVFVARSAAEWERDLTRRDIACVEVMEGDPGRFLNTNAWAREQGLLVEIEHPALGRYLRQGTPWVFSETPGVAGATNYLGEHTRPILRELGYSEAQINEMEQANVILCHKLAPASVS